MAITRHATGHSAPRKPEPTLAARIKAPFTTKKPPTTTTITTTTSTKTTTTGGRTGSGSGGKAKANTSQPRARAATTTTNTTASGRVTKSGAGVGRPPLKNRPRKTGVKDKVEGVLEKVVGEVEGRPGKKAAGTKKIRGTDGKGTTRAKR